MSSTDILIQNLKSYSLHEFSLSNANPIRKSKPDSMRSIAKKINFSQSVLLNWSSNRSSPNIEQIIEIAYIINTEPYQLLIENNSALWSPMSYFKPYTINDFYNNLRTLRLEKGIHQNIFDNDYSCSYDMTYREFLRYINGKNKNFTLKALDIFAEILQVEPYMILKGRD